MVKKLKNGPLEISGGVKVLDYKRKEFADARRSGLSLSWRPIKK
jgi:hypothetical protein